MGVWMGMGMGMGMGRGLPPRLDGGRSYGRAVVDGKRGGGGLRGAGRWTDVLGSVGWSIGRRRGLKATTSLVFRFLIQTVGTTDCCTVSIAPNDIPDIYTTVHPSVPPRTSQSHPSRNPKHVPILELIPSNPCQPVKPRPKHKPTKLLYPSPTPRPVPHARHTV